MVRQKIPFLAPPAGRQWNFSNTDSSVVVVRRQLFTYYLPLRGNFLKNCLITFSLFCHEASQGGCWWTAKRWIWLNNSKGQFSRSERSKKRLNFAVLLLFANFLKNGLITFLYFLYTASWGWYWSTIKRWVSLNYSKCHCQGRRGKI